MHRTMYEVKHMHVGIWVRKSGFRFGINDAPFFIKASGNQPDSFRNAEKIFERMAVLLILGNKGDDVVVITFSTCVTVEISLAIQN